MKHVWLGWILVGASCGGGAACPEGWFRVEGTDTCLVASDLCPEGGFLDEAGSCVGLDGTPVDGAGAADDTPADDGSEDDPGDDPGPSGDDDDGPLGEDAFSEQFAELFCERTNECLVADELEPIDCQGDDEVGDTFEVECDYDAVRAEQCLEELEEAECDGPLISTPSVCGDVFSNCG